MNKNYIDSMFSLDGKVALVTGAARGNGKAIAEALMMAGAYVYCVDILENELKLLSETINKKTGEIVLSDVTDDIGNKVLIENIIEEKGAIDLLVNNAGITIGSNDLFYPDSDWDLTYEINLKSIFKLCKSVLPSMIDNGGGGIINVTSLGAQMGFSNNQAYVAFKGGLKQYSKALAKDVSRFNVRVNNLCPGYIVTDMTKKSYNNPDLKRTRDERIMLHRWGQPEDLGGAVVFLASNASSYITASDIYVDGGWLSNGV